MSEQHVRWFVQPRELEDLTPQRARDIVVKCFFEAQKESFVEASQHIGRSLNHDDIMNSVLGAVRLAFRETNGDFDNPTKASLSAAVAVLARKASSWGTPAEIVAHHKGQIERVLQALA